MDRIVLIVEKGGFRRSFERIARKSGYWTQTIYPDDFCDNVLALPDVNIPAGLDAEYQYVKNKLFKMGMSLKDGKGICLLVSGITEESTRTRLMEDFGAFSVNELGNKPVQEIFRILSGENKLVEEI